jgi:hypothetical protein
MEEAQYLETDSDSSTAPSHQSPRVTFGSPPSASFRTPRRSRNSPSFYRRRSPRPTPDSPPAFQPSAYSLPLRAELAPGSPPIVNPIAEQLEVESVGREQLENAIEIATYLILEERNIALVQHQKNAVVWKIIGALPFITQRTIVNQVNHLHPVFIAKAEAATAISGRSVAQRLSDPSDPFRVGDDHRGTAAPQTTEVVEYADDMHLYFNV